MPIELSILPPMVVEQIMSVKNGNPVQFTNNSEAVLTLTEEIKQPSYAKGDFDYDLERMKYMMDTEFMEMPKGTAKDLETFEKWLAGAFK